MSSVLWLRRDLRLHDHPARPVPLVATGSPYPLAPGRVRTKQGSPFQVFAPVASHPAGVAWCRHV